MIAARAAERLNAILAAKSMGSAKTGPGVGAASGASSAAKEPLFVEEIEINDAPNRFHLTKGTTHAEVSPSPVS